MTQAPAETLRLTTTIRSDATLRLALEPRALPAPGPGEVTIAIEAAPMNPSDLGLLVGPADMSQATASVEDGRPVITAPVPEKVLPALAARIDKALPAGNEGCGTVIAAGEGAEGLMGKRVTALGGAMFATHITLRAKDCMPLPDGTTPAQGASAFVNPLTALCFVETLRRDGHSAFLHSAAASNLGQMLVKLCKAEGIGLVNIVRKPEQAELLRGLGAEHVVDSSQPDFMDRLVEATEATGATSAFDAIGGGRTISTMLRAMETVMSRGQAFSRYGSSTRKRAYVYGRLDPSPLTIDLGVGFAWDVSGWLMPDLLGSLPADRQKAVRERAAAELTTTFASTYTAEIGLAQALDLETLHAYNRRATGEKYLVTPQA